MPEQKTNKYISMKMPSTRNLIKQHERNVIEEYNDGSDATQGKADFSRGILTLALDRVRRLEVENKALDIYSKSVTADIKKVQEENTRLKEYISAHQEELIAAVG